MKKLKHIRILISLLMLGECLMLALLGAAAPLHARLAGATQLGGGVIVTSVAATMGAWVLWLIVTLLLGRVYCGAFCPAGALQDIFFRLRQICSGGRAHYRKKSARPLRWWVLGAYICAIILGAGVVPLVVEPWPALVNVAEQFNGHSSLPHSMAVCAGVGAAWGLVCAGVSAVILVAFALLTGRDLCNDVCPVGSILTLAGSKAAMHIEFYPDRCTACLKCEDVCKAGCIDIKNRTIDDARCLRCFNCIAECPDDALKYQLNPNGIITPLFRPGGAQTSASNRN